MVKEPVKFDKITAANKKMCYGRFPGFSRGSSHEGYRVYMMGCSSDLDSLAAEVAAAKTIDHQDYALLASRIAVSNLHKNQTFLMKEDLYNYIDPKTEKMHCCQRRSMTSSWKIKPIDSILYTTETLDTITFFKNLTRSYLMKLNGEMRDLNKC